MLKAQSYGMRDVVYTGLQTGDDLHALIEGSAFAIHPSETEGLPIAVLEKMSHGKAVLASDIPEHLELVEDKGYTFRVGDVQDLMLQLYWCATHLAECEKYGERAKRYVEKHYLWDTVAKSTGNVYRAFDLKAPAKRPTMTVSTASRHLVS
jgi:glycosyltransferase involved in cell wall biosynthesis